jgi:alkylation response protein AidB-like acyl-CoA dehydrogenase
VTGELEAFRDAAVSALVTDTGRALERLEWWDAIEGYEASTTARLAFAAFFEAEGRTLSTTRALDQLVVRAVVGHRCDDITIAVGVRRDGDRLRFAVPTASRGASTVLACTAGAWHRFDGCRLALAEGESLDPSIFEVMAVDADRSVTVTPARSSGLPLARLAIAHHILGCSDSLLETTVEHAMARQQFGRPVGTYQAVQHLLADAHTRRAALRDLCHAASETSRPGWPGPNLSSVVKAYAGTAGRVVAQATLQTLGAIGFTEEHSHQRHYRRIVALDAALGNSRELHRELGARVLEVTPVDRLVDLA